MNQIGIIGAGGVGGYFGGKLCHLQDPPGAYSVSFLARGAHLRAIRETGLQLSSETDGEMLCKPGLATDNFQELPPLDLCLLCVKEFDLAAALDRLAPRIHERTVILPLLNGVDVPERVRARIQHGIVLAACVYVGTHIERPGRVVQRGGACRIYGGPDSRQPEFDPGPLLATFAKAGIRCEWTPAIQEEIWKKFIFICAYGLVLSGGLRKHLGRNPGGPAAHFPREGRHRRSGGGRARTSGVVLPTDIERISFEKARTFPSSAKTSFQRDFELSGRPDERDLFAGSLLRLGARLGIDTPVTRDLDLIGSDQAPVE